MYNRIDLASVRFEEHQSRQKKPKTPSPMDAQWMPRTVEMTQPIYEALVAAPEADAEQIYEKLYC